MATPKIALSISLTIPLSDALSEAANARGIGRSTFVRQALEQALSTLRKKNTKLASDVPEAQIPYDGESE